MIYVRGAEKIKTAKELLCRNFSHREYGVVKFKATYHDKTYKFMQCIPARRSFKDLVAIVQTYFPRVTKARIAYLLLCQIPNMRCFYCPRTSLNVFVVDKKWIGDFYWDNNQWASHLKDNTGYSFDDIQNLADSYYQSKKS